ncbi:hypothetical protein M378DRAFT_179145 [Amanita muscaria Koide BX008]|uniref:C2H2-type domain-containing protein n=1 Tax=Amanita muscaria (strain Koide BX008) TaxID=946122 RepID=A0A0C2SKF1_AMAMK|nr:hypothetical protein M378DRAFT_179145 [Amanita muscaria Koide BX008]
MSTTQPIALPNSHSNLQDYIMADGSYTGSSGSFNPASYARHFLGSPISWRQGSFSSRFLSTSPSPNFLNSLEYNDIKYPKMSTSIDSDRGSILNALNVFDREGELCRNYTCCGLHLNDMHALVEHLEEAHFGAYNRNAVNQQAQVQMPYNSQSIHPDHPISPTTQVPNQVPSHVGSSQIAPANVHTYPSSFDPDDMEFELDLETSSVPHAPTAHSSPSSGVPTPPDTPITTPLSVYPANALPNGHLLPNSQAHSLSQPASPPYDASGHVSAAASAATTRHSSPSGASTRPNLNLNLSAFQRSTQFGTSSPSVLNNPEEAFNSYARYASDFSACMPGTQYTSAEASETGIIQANWQQQHSSNHTAGQCVPPALLFSTSASTTPLSTPDGSRVPSPSGYSTITQSSAPPTPNRSTPPASGRSSSRTGSAVASSTLSRPASSLLLSKPFKCPKPNCNKSYKQANGLKYHMTHGSCNFAPPKDLEHVKDLLERKRRDREKLNGTADDSSSGALGRSQSLGSIGEGNDGDSFDSLTSIMSNISESELREVEREAERRMKPFACGVGDCQRRYKNMNGLRYHYQHSGDHGAVGLALLASGQHECLQGQKRNHNSASSQQNGEEKDIKRRSSVHLVGMTSRGSSSMPVSRASSRTGTPQPLPQSPLAGSHYSPPNANASISVPAGINTMGITHAQPFTPPQAGSQQALSSPTQGQVQTPAQQQQQLAAAYQQQYAAQFQRQQQQYQQYAQAQAVQAQVQQTPQMLYGDLS